jgi:hypothetical protein
VRPRLLLLESGTLVMSGGRMCKGQAEHAPSCPPLDQASVGGVFLWVNEDGMADLDHTRNGSEWVPYCVTAAHNRLWHGDPHCSGTTPPAPKPIRRWWRWALARWVWRMRTASHCLTSPPS